MGIFRFSAFSEANFHEFWGLDLLKHRFQRCFFFKNQQFFFRVAPRSSETLRPAPEVVHGHAKTVVRLEVRFFRCQFSFRLVLLGVMTGGCKLLVFCPSSFGCLYKFEHWQKLRCIADRYGRHLYGRTHFLQISDAEESAIV